MLALFRSCISDEEMIAIIRKLHEKAAAGDTSAAKLIFSYKIGKPAPAPNPDQIDRDEWDQYKRDTINLEEVQKVLGSLPAKVGNDIARTALPIMTEARKEELASQLRKGCPAEEATIAPLEDKAEEVSEAAPLPNEDLKDATRAGRPTVRGRRRTPGGLHNPSGGPDSVANGTATRGINSGANNEPIPIGKTKRNARRGANDEPIPIGKSTVRAGRNKKPKKFKAHWLRTMAGRLKG
jgi:hypothetical protein